MLFVCHNNSKEKFLDSIIFILVILFFYFYERFSGLQEILIFSFLVILSKYFSELINVKNKYYILFIILGCNLIIWIKAEGIVYSCILILLLNFSKHVSKKIKNQLNITYLALILLKIIIYKFSNLTLNAQPYYFGYISEMNFELLIYKLKFILPYLLYYSVNNVFFISGIIILFVLTMQKKGDDYTKLLNYYFLFNFIFIFCAYLLRDMEIEHSVKATMERIVFTSSGFYVFLVVNFVKNLGKRIK